MGKALGNGFPISVLAGRADVMDRLGPKGDVLFAGTFAGHTLNARPRSRSPGSSSRARSTITCVGWATG